MIIDRNISKYVVLDEESLLAAIRKIDENQSRLVFTVDENGVLQGVITDATCAVG